MKKTIYSILSAICLLYLIGCSTPKYSIFRYDNGDDYFREGLHRIVGKDGKIGFADEKGNVVISPRFAFVFPFENGLAKATHEGHQVAEGEHWQWISPEWFYIDHKGDIIRNDHRYSQIEERLKTYVAAQDTRIGVAVIIDGKDTVLVNGNRDFPMLSVYKFPQALAVADYCMKKGITLSDTIGIQAKEIKEDTWSPMRNKYGVSDLRLPLSEILEYSLQQSDNNACDVLFRLIGGPQVSDSLMKASGYGDITIGSTEDEMHRDPYLCYQNRATPIAMARLFDKFYRLEMRHDSPVHEAVGAMMMLCGTGDNRLPAPLAATDAVIAHKTGTGGRNTQGRIVGINDAGYVFLPNGRGYAIAVFIADSAYDMARTEKIIADISKIVYQSLEN